MMWSLSCVNADNENTTHTHTEPAIHFGYVCSSSGGNFHFISRAFQEWTAFANSHPHATVPVREWHNVNWHRVSVFGWLEAAAQGITKECGTVTCASNSRNRFFHSFDNRHVCGLLSFLLCAVECECGDALKWDFFVLCVFPFVLMFGNCTRTWQRIIKKIYIRKSRFLSGSWRTAALSTYTIHTYHK